MSCCCWSLIILTPSMNSFCWMQHVQTRKHPFNELVKTALFGDILQILLMNPISAGILGHNHPPSFPHWSISGTLVILTNLCHLLIFSLNEQPPGKWLKVDIKVLPGKGLAFLETVGLRQNLQVHGNLWVLGNFQNNKTLLKKKEEIKTRTLCCFVVQTQWMQLLGRSWAELFFSNLMSCSFNSPYCCKIMDMFNGAHWCFSYETQTF